MKRFLALFLTLLLIFGITACQTPAPEPVESGWYSANGITITEEQVERIVNGEFTTAKNVIVIIGDGMGPDDITLAEEYAKGVYDFGLVLNKLKNHGLATTHSASDEVTDSAASGTALATGVKTNNEMIGKDPEGNDLKNLAEYAREAGKKIGIITDEDISGATPSAFVVHNVSRDNRRELTSAMVKFKPDVLMSKDYNSVIPYLDAEAQGIFDGEYVVAKDFARFDAALATDSNNEKPFWGFLNGYSTIASDNLAQCTEVALKRLQNENGFFLMIESAGTDKFGHGGNMQGKLNSVVTLDRTVAAVLKFMEKNPDTLLVITSDHETGGVQLPVTGEESLSDLLTLTEHTATAVRVFGVGKGTEYFSDKMVDNTDIAKFLIEANKGE